MPNHQVNAVAGVEGQSARVFAPNHRWWVLGVGAAAQASFSASFAGLPVTGVLMRDVYAITTEQLGLVLGSMALGITLSEVFWGMLTDRLGDRKVLLLGLLSTAAALVLLAIFCVPTAESVPSYELLCAGLVLVGLLGGSVNSSSGRAVMAWFNDGKRGFAMSIRQTAVPVGGAIGAAILPWMGRAYGFQAVYLTLACFSVLSALMAWLWLFEPRSIIQQRSVANDFKTVSPLRRWDIWKLAMACGLLTMPQIAVLTFGGIFLNDQKNASLLTISASIIALQVTGAIARIGIGYQSDRGFERIRLMRIIGFLAAMATGALAIFSGANLAFSVALVCLSGVLSSAWHGIAFTEAAVMAGPDRAGTAIGILGMTIFATAAVTPAVIPHVLAMSSWQFVWGAIACAALLAVQVTRRSS